ncbi:flippase [Leuconostoc citreum]|nr:flippase [Leuconostoc citreum]MCT3080195.1 flippase [Leuconostoc citreum]MCT3082424.1 flippase [Leuconostoc citreum]
MKRLKVNFLYNSVFQILTLIVPLITTPYVARILGANNLGIFAYTNANTNYFTILASLGFNLYAQNEVAKVRENKLELARVFSNVFITRLICSMVVFVVFSFFNMFFFKSYNILYWILSFQIIGVAFDVSWLFMGLEEFKKISIRNLVVKIINTMLVFLLVHSQDDLLIYAIIIMFGIIISNLIVWSDVKKYIFSWEFDSKLWKKILCASLVLFLPTTAITVYTDIIRTFLGIVTTKNYVGYYVQADMLIKVILSVITSLGTVVMPYVSHLISNGGHAEVKELIKKSFNIITTITMPVVVLVITFSDNFIPFFLGSGFLPTAELLKINVISVIFAAWGNVLGIQYLLPIGKIKEYTISTTLPAVSIIFTAPILYNFLGVAGVMVAIVIVQILVFVIQLNYLKKDLDIISLFSGFPKIVINCGIMYAAILIFKSISEVKSNFLALLFGGSIGIFVYAVGHLYMLRINKN